MNKHTPGPWNVSKDWDGTSIMAGPHYVTHTISACGFHSQEDDKAVTQANARLIAAAPDLLEVLQDLMECRDALLNNRQLPMTTEEWETKCFAALAKATGSAA